MGEQQEIGAGHTQCVVVSNVGSQATDERGGAGIPVELCEHLCRGLQVVGPAEPASVASVEVHVDAKLVELLDSIGDTGLQKESGVSVADPWSGSRPFLRTL